MLFRSGAEILVSGADAVAEADPRKACQMLLEAASVAAKIGDIAQLGAISRRLGALPGGGDEVDALRIDLVVGVGGLIEGNTGGIPRIERSVAGASAFGDPRLLSWAAMGAAALGDAVAETAHLRHAVAAARESRAVDTLVFVLENVVHRGNPGVIHAAGFLCFQKHYAWRSCTSSEYSTA